MHHLRIREGQSIRSRDLSTRPALLMKGINAVESSDYTEKRHKPGLPTCLGSCIERASGSERLAKLLTG